MSEQSKGQGVRISKKTKGSQIVGTALDESRSGALNRSVTPTDRQFQEMDSKTTGKTFLKRAAKAPKNQHLSFKAQIDRVEAALRKSNHLQATIGRLAKIGGWELEIETSEVEWAEETFHIHELPVGEIPSLKEALSYYHVDDRPILEAALKNATEAGHSFDLQLRFITAKGNPLWVHTAGFPEVINGKTVKLYGMIRDITATKNLEQHLKDREKHARQLIENSEISIWSEDMSDVREALNSLKADGVVNLREHLRNNRDLAITISRKIKVLHVNAATIRLFEAQTLGDFMTHIEKTFSDKSLDVFCDVLCALWEEKKIFWAETTFKTLKGRIFDAIVTIQIPNTTEDFKLVPVSFVDISANKVRERELNARIKELHVLYSVLDLLDHSGQEFSKTMQAIVEILPSAWQIPETTMAEIVVHGTCYRSAQFEQTPWNQKSGIIIEDQEIGRITICCLTENRKNGETTFLEEEQTLLNKVAERLSEHIKTRRTNEQLNSAGLGAINAISATIEKRDPYTSGHQSRVADLCVAIAGQLNWTPSKIEGLRLGALIHDIGKISIPSDILNRPSRLSEMEFNIIKTHPVVGYEIVEHTNFNWPIKEMIIQHHERIDGSGYPRGLLGDQIIDEAKVIAVADVVEAISSHRPYRADRDQLVQVVINVVSNAIKFCHHPGGIIRVTSSVEQNGLLVKVSDNGSGVLPEHRDFIFEKFHQSRRGSNQMPIGTGLGLAICRQIITFFGGNIWADNNADGGAVISFDIPFAP